MELFLALLGCIAIIGVFGACLLALSWLKFSWEAENPELAARARAAREVHQRREAERRRKQREADRRKAAARRAAEARRRRNRPRPRPRRACPVGSRDYDNPFNNGE